MLFLTNILLHLSVLGHDIFNSTDKDGTHKLSHLDLNKLKHLQDLFLALATLKQGTNDHKEATDIYILRVLSQVCEGILANFLEKCSH